MAKTFRFNTRRWLNREGFHGMAHIIARVEDTSVRHGGGHKEGCGEDARRPECYCFSYPDIQLEIADCSRSISLDFTDAFDPDDHDARSNAFYKIDSLIEDLINFRAAMAAEAKYQAAVRREVRDAKAAKEEATAAPYRAA